MQSILTALITAALLASISESKAVPSGSCPPDKPVVHCKADPCQVNDCPSFPDATCKSDYCGGCFAHFYYRGKEVTKQCECLLPKVVGPCEAAIPRYYYNSKTKKCEFFFYGGCEGNGNNFETKKECEATCKRGK